MMVMVVVGVQGTLQSPQRSSVTVVVFEMKDFIGDFTSK